MNKVLIIDDEESARYVIRHIIGENCPDLVVVGEADGVETGLQAIEQLQPNLVILDVQLRDGNGFDILRSLDFIGFKIVFVTAWEKYALEAFQFSALSYFLKPVDPKHFSTSLNTLFNPGEKDNTSLKLNAFFSNLLPDFEGGKKIVLEADSGVYLINVNDIIHYEGAEERTKFYLKNDEQIIINKPLKNYEQMFRDYRFFKIEKNHLFNLHHFKKISGNDHHYIITSEDRPLAYNPEKKKSLLEALIIN